jgi:hypothetical protein
LTTTKMHELIDPKDPVCLYCNGPCDIALDDRFLSSSTTIYDTEILTCQDCNEKFSIASFQNEKGETTYMAFSFTCKKYQVVFLYADESFDLYTRRGKHIVTLPPFQVNFSDKKKLFEKLKTYVIFS